MARIDRTLHRMPVRGRDRELAEATAILRRASGDDARPGAVVIRGAAGSGKSRLLAAIAARAGDVGFRVLTGGGDADAASMPMTPLLQAVLGGTPPLMDRRTVHETLRSADARYVVIEDIIEALEDAARRRPVLMVVDDLQFADPTTLFALRVMIERLAAEPMVWAVATREPVRDDAVARTVERLEDLDAATFTIGELPSSAATAVAEDLLGGTVDDNLRSMIDRTGGYVVDLVETLRGLVDERRVHVDDGRAVLRETMPPARLRDAIGRRMSRLTPEVSEIVAAASVMGRLVTDRGIAALTGVALGDAGAGLRAAEHAQLMVDTGEAFAFRHDLIREVVEATLSPALRRELRRRAVDVALDSGAPLLEVASALASTAERGDTRAADLLSQAGATLATFDPSTAADLVGRAVELTVDDPERQRKLLTEHVVLLWQAGRVDDARVIGERALVAGVSTAQEAEIRLGLALAASEHSYLDAGRHTAIALRLPDLPPGQRARLLAADAVTKIMVNDLDGLDSTLDEAMTLAHRVDDVATQTSVLATRSTLAMHRMQWDVAFELAEQGRRTAEGIADPASMWSPKGLWQAILLSTSGYSEEALRITERGMADAAAGRQGAAVSLWMMVRARVLLESGRLTDAEAEAESVFALSDWRERSTMADYTINFVLRRVAQYTGDHAALKRTEPALTAMQRADVGTVRRQGKWLAALEFYAAGHPEQALDVIAENIEMYGDVGHPFTLDPTDDPLFARIAARAGRRDLAARAAGHAEWRARGNANYPLLQAVAAHTRALVDDDPDALAAAAAGFADVDRPLPRAEALLDAGRVSVDRDTAVDLLDEAHDVFATAGALRDAARTRQRLRALGVRRRQPSRAVGDDRLAGLTASERAVVDLVVRGATNREVAAQLFLSPHTVSTHLRHAFTKAGVRSRLELARLASLGDAG